MKKRWLAIVIILILIASLAGPALAGRWHLSLTGGYGNYPLNWETNEFIKRFNAWTGDTLGISDFRIGQLEKERPLYSAGLKLESPSSRWELGLDLNYRGLEMYEEQKSMTILEGGTEKFIWAYGSIVGGMAFADLMLYHKFTPRGLRPFIGFGITYCAAAVQGYYNAFEETLNSYEQKSLYQSFEAIDFLWGQVLAIGIEWKSVNGRIGVEARYHRIPPIQGEIEIENDGFSTVPIEPRPFEVNVGGEWDTHVYLVFYF